MMAIKTPLIKRIISYIARAFLEDSGYKQDLHKDLTALLLEVRSLNDAVHDVLSEYKNAITLVKMRQFKIQQETREE